MFRRRFIALVSTSWLLGCVTGERADVSAAIEIITFRNESTDPVSASIAITEHEAAVFSRSEVVASGTNIAIESPVDEPGHYRVRVATPQDSVSIDAASHVSDGGQGLFIVVSLKRGGGLTTDVRTV